MQLTLFMNLELHWTLNRNNISAKRPVPVFINSANVNKCHVAKDKMKQLVAATVLSRLDYCNSVLMDILGQSMLQYNVSIMLLLSLCVVRHHVTMS